MALEALDSGAVKAMPMFGLVFAASESRVGLGKAFETLQSW